MAAGKGKASVLGQCLLQQLPFQESQPLPAPCPPVLHTADSTRHSPPPSRSPVVPGDPSRTRPRPCRRLSTAQRLAAISPSCSSNAFAAGAGQDIDRQPPSMSSLRLSRQREPPPGCSAQEAAFPSPQPFSSAPCATAPLPAALLPQFPQQQGSHLGDPAGSATSAPGWGQLCQLQGTPGRPNLLCQGLTGSVCPHVALDTPAGCLCLTSGLTGISLCPSGSDPSAAARGPAGHPLRHSPPVAFPARHGARQRR